MLGILSEAIQAYFMLIQQVPFKRTLFRKRIDASLIWTFVENYWYLSFRLRFSSIQLDSIVLYLLLFLLLANLLVYRLALKLIQRVLKNMLLLFYFRLFINLGVFANIFLLCLFSLFFLLDRSPFELVFLNLLWLFLLSRLLTPLVMDFEQMLG